SSSNQTPFTSVGSGGTACDAACRTQSGTLTRAYEVATSMVSANVAQSAILVAARDIGARLQQCRLIISSLDSVKEAFQFCVLSLKNYAFTHDQIATREQPTG